MPLAHTTVIVAPMVAYIAQPAATLDHVIQPAINDQRVKTDAVTEISSANWQTFLPVIQTQRVTHLFNVRKYERNCH